MKNKSNDIKVYGAERCHKTRFYMDYLKDRNQDFVFLDVEQDEAAAKGLRNLYITGKLNFPTILINGKKLRNPRISELEKRL